MRKNGVRRLLAGGVLSSTSFLLSWPWVEVHPTEELTPAEEVEVTSRERKMAKILPPQGESERLFEKLGYSIFIFIAFCMIIEVFLMDDDDGPTPSASTDS